MTQSNKIRVAVLYGGRSAEHEVSLQSAANVIQYLDANRFDVTPVGIDKAGNWFLGNEIFVKSLANNKIPKQLSVNTWFTPEWIGKPAEQQPVKELLLKNPNQPLFDVIFPVVHGALCEDGSLQGLLELANLPYVGCGVLASAIGMDKDVAKRLASMAGIPVAPYLVLRHFNRAQQLDQFLADVARLGFPVFVKPANTGSSIGITKVTSADKLLDAINFAFEFDSKILVEKGLDAQELEISVLESLENDDPIASVVGEIKCRHEFYSYHAKYVDEHGAELLIPANISAAKQAEAQALARKIFRVLECEGMARVDLFCDKQTSQLYFNEINTIPGFTQISMYPKLMTASGMSYSALLTHLVELALKRHKQKSQLVRSYTD